MKVANYMRNDATASQRFIFKEEEERGPLYNIIYINGQAR